MKRIFYSFNGRLTLCMIISALGMLITIALAFQQFSSLIHEQVNNKINSISLQVEESIYGTQTQIEKASRIASYSTPMQLFLLSSSPEVVIENMPKASDIWSNSSSYNAAIKNIYLYSDKKRHLSYNTAYWNVIREQLELYGFYESISFTDPFFSNIFYISDDGKSSLSSPQSDSTPYSIYFYPVYSALSSMDNSKNHIVSAILCDMSNFCSVFDDGKAGSYYLIMENNSPIIVKGNVAQKALLDSLISRNYQDTYISFCGTTYVVKRVNLKKVQTEFLYIAEEDKLVGSLYASRNFSLFILTAISVITIIILSAILRQMQTSINDIIYDTTHLRTRVEQVKIRSSNLIELNNMADAINDMIYRLDASAKIERQNETKLLKARIAQNNAELIGYRSQINPHFLFNTMECMRSMAHIYKAEPVENIVSSMANMFRYSLYSPMVVNLSEEIKHIENYINVMKQRYPNRFTLKCRIQEKALNYNVISMVLQPIVENAVQHAFPPKQKNCIIFVSANIINNCLHIKICDNGRGMSFEQLNNLKSYIKITQDNLLEEKSSISLQNIYKRMSLICGTDFSMSFYSKENHYTLVHLIIPPNIKEINY